MDAISILLIIEILGVTCSVTEVLYARVNNILLYPFGIAGILLSTILFCLGGLYAHAILNLYYLVMSIYGWYIWSNPAKHKVMPTSFSNQKDWAISLVIVSSSFLILQWILKSFTDSQVPIWDAWVSATAWAGMWLLSRRKVENWLLLNISNAFAIPLYIYKGFYLYAALTLFLFIVAIDGYRKWRKQVIQASKSPIASL